MKAPLDGRSDAVVETFECTPTSHNWQAEFYFYYDGVLHSFEYPNSMTVLTTPENAAKMEYGRRIDKARAEFLRDVSIRSPIQ